MTYTRADWSEQATAFRPFPGELIILLAVAWVTGNHQIRDIIGRNISTRHATDRKCMLNVVLTPRNLLVAVVALSLLALILLSDLLWSMRALYLFLTSPTIMAACFTILPAYRGSMIAFVIFGTLLAVCVIPSLCSLITVLRVSIAPSFVILDNVLVMGLIPLLIVLNASLFMSLTIALIILSLVGSSFWRCTLCPRICTATGLTIACKSIAGYPIGIEVISSRGIFATTGIAAFARSIILRYSVHYVRSPFLASRLGVLVAPLRQHHVMSQLYHRSATQAIGG